MGVFRVTMASATSGRTMNAKKQVTWAAPGTFAYAKAKRQRSFTPTYASKVLCQAANADEASNAAHILPRREALNLGLFAASASYLRTCLGSSNLALADDLTIFWGAADPPATYGKSARTTKEFARYSFVYPPDWKEQAINKVEKGTNGTDCRLTGGLRTKEQIYIVVLQRLGEDFKGYAVNDVGKALSGIAVADANLQDALAQSETKVFKKREADGQTFFDLDLDSTNPYYITLTNDGNWRYFAVFITANSKGFAAKKDLFGKMRDSFRTYVIL